MSSDNRLFVIFTAFAVQVRRPPPIDRLYPVWTTARRVIRVHVNNTYTIVIIIIIAFVNRFDFQTKTRTSLQRVLARITYNATPVPRNRCGKNIWRFYAVFTTFFFINYVAFPKHAKPFQIVRWTGEGFTRREHLGNRSEWVFVVDFRDVWIISVIIEQFKPSLCLHPVCLVLQCVLLSCYVRKVQKS